MHPSFLFLLPGPPAKVWAAAGKGPRGRQAAKWSPQWLPLNTDLGLPRRAPMGTLPGLPLGAQPGASFTSSFMASEWGVKEGDPAGHPQTYAKCRSLAAESTAPPFCRLGN